MGFLLRGFLIILTLVILLFTVTYNPANSWGIFTTKSSFMIDFYDLQYIFIYWLPFGLAVAAHIVFSDGTNNAKTAISSESKRIKKVDVVRHHIKSRWTWSYREIMFAVVLVLVNFLWVAGPVLGRYQANPQTKAPPQPLTLKSFIATAGRKAGQAGMWSAALAIVLVVRENHLLKAILGQDTGEYHTTLKFHVATGYTSFCWITFHAIQYLVGYANDGVLQLNVYPWMSNLGYHNFIGILAWCCLGLMLIFSVYKIRRINFQFFYFTHQLYMLFILGAFLHYFGTFYPMIGPLLYFIWDRIAPRLNMKRTVDVRITKASDKVVRVDIPLAAGYRNTAGYAPGDWLNIRIPAVSYFTWHPFSVVTYYPESPDHITLLCAVRGSFTKKLLQVAEQSKTGIFKANVDGLFGSRSNSYTEHDHMVFIGGGTGVGALTPFLKHYTRVRPSGNAHFVWVAKDAQSASSFSDLVKEIDSLRSNGSNFQLHLHLTRGLEFAADHSVEKDDVKYGSPQVINVQVEKPMKGAIPHHQTETAVLERSSRTSSKLTAFFVAYAIFGAGIGLYCVGRLYQFTYNAKVCGAPSAYTLRGSLHFICHYYYYAGPALYAIFGAAFAGLLFAITNGMFKSKIDPVETYVPLPTTADKEHTLSVVKQFPFIAGRPRIDEILADIQNEAERNGGDVGVMAAGPEGILRSIQGYAVGNPMFTFYRESWKV